MSISCFIGYYRCFFMGPLLTTQLIRQQGKPKELLGSRICLQSTTTVFYFFFLIFHSLVPLFCFPCFITIIINRFLIGYDENGYTSFPVRSTMTIWVPTSSPPQKGDFTCQCI